MVTEYYASQLALAPDDEFYEEAKYVKENGLSLIDFDWWTHIETLLGKKIPYSDYQKIDRAVDDDILELTEEDVPMIRKILSGEEMTKRYLVELAGVIEVQARDEREAEYLARMRVTLDDISEARANEI